MAYKYFFQCSSSLFFIVFRVGALTISSGSLFQVSTTRCLKNFCVAVFLHLGFLNLKQCPRVEAGLSSISTGNSLTLYILCTYLYTSMTSPRVLLYCREGSFSLFNLSGYGRSSSPGNSLVARLWTPSNNILCLAKIGYVTALQYSKWVRTSDLNNMVKVSGSNASNDLLIRPSWLFALFTCLST